MPLTSASASSGPEAQYSGRDQEVRDVSGYPQGPRRPDSPRRQKLTAAVITPSSRRPKPSPGSGRFFVNPAVPAFRKSPARHRRTIRGKVRLAPGPTERGFHVDDCTRSRDRPDSRPLHGWTNRPPARSPDDRRLPDPAPLGLRRPRRLRHPGDFVLNFYGMLTDSPLRVIGATREDCAGYAADAYARVHGLGACCVTYCVGGLSTCNSIAGPSPRNPPWSSSAARPASRNVATTPCSTTKSAISIPSSRSSKNHDRRRVPR